MARTGWHLMFHCHVRCHHSAHPSRRALGGKKKKGETGEFEQIIGLLYSPLCPEIARQPGKALDSSLRPGPLTAPGRRAILVRRERTLKVDACSPESATLFRRARCWAAARPSTTTAAVREEERVILRDAGRFAGVSFTVAGSGAQWDPAAGRGVAQPAECYARGARTLGWLALRASLRRKKDRVFGTCQGGLRMRARQREREGQSTNMWRERRAGRSWPPTNFASASA